MWHILTMYWYLILTSCIVNDRNVGLAALLTVLISLQLKASEYKFVSHRDSISGLDLYYVFWYHAKIWTCVHED